MVIKWKILKVPPAYCHIVPFSYYVFSLPFEGNPPFFLFQHLGFLIAIAGTEVWG